MEQRCGRPTKTTGQACQQRRARSRPACNRHLTAEDRVETERREQGILDYLNSLDLPAQATKPHCWSWPVTDADRLGGSLHLWQRGRCATCGEEDRLVRDHDHETGMVRGYLCRGCNTSEGSSNHRVFQRYRRWNPARILDVWEHYVSPFHGRDYGQWSGRTIHGPVPVTPSGVVLFETPSADSHPSFIVGRLLLGHLRTTDRGPS